MPRNRAIGLPFSGPMIVAGVVATNNTGRQAGTSAENRENGTSQDFDDGKIGSGAAGRVSHPGRA